MRRPSGSVVSEELGREPPIDDDDLRAGGAVGLDERAAALQRDAEGVEVARARIDNRHSRPCGRVAERLSLDLELEFTGTAERQRRGERRVRDAWQRADALLQRVEEDPALLGLRILALDELRAERQHVPGFEPEVERVQLQEAARHQPRAGEQRERQRQLADDERRGQPARSRAAGLAAASLLHQIVEIGLRDLQRWREPEDDAGREADHGEVAEHRQVES